MPPTALTEIIEVRQRGWWIALCISIAGVATGIWMFIRLGAGVYLAAGTLVLACAYFAMKAWLRRPGSSFLAISREGLRVKFGGESSFFEWSEIEKFGVAEIPVRRHGLHRAVGIRFINPKKSLCRNRDGFSPQKRGRTEGFDAVLFCSYGKDCAELAEHLNRLRERYVSKPHGKASLEKEQTSHEGNLEKKID